MGFMAGLLLPRDVQLAEGDTHCEHRASSASCSASLLALAYGYRIRTEERMLVAALGATYEEYCRRSWRLVPFVF